MSDVFTAMKRLPEDYRFAYLQVSFPNPEDEIVDGNDSYGNLDGNGPDGITYPEDQVVIDGNTLDPTLDGNDLEGILDGNNPA